jgi:hypothetical protein
VTAAFRYSQEDEVTPDSEKEEPIKQVEEVKSFEDELSPQPTPTKALALVISQPSPGSFVD